MNENNSITIFGGGKEGEERYGFYQKLRKKIKEYLKTKDGKEHKYAEYLLLAPDLFYLLCKLALDPNVPGLTRTKIGAAIVYFISPFDIIPEGVLGPIGYLDDVVVASYVLNEALNKVDESIIQKYWLGDGDVLEVFQKVIKRADQLCGAGIWEKIKDALKENIIKKQSL